MPDSLSTSAIGMAMQREKLNQAAYNISVMNTASRPGESSDVYHLVFESLLSSGEVITPDALQDVSQYVELKSERYPLGEKLIYEPRNPLADKGGFVSYPDVDHLQEMITVVNAKKMYEANVKAFNASKSMMTEALNIGR